MLVLLLFYVCFVIIYCFFVLICVIYCSVLLLVFCSSINYVFFLDYFCLELKFIKNNLSTSSSRSTLLVPFCFWGFREVCCFEQFQVVLLCGSLNSIIIYYFVTTYYFLVLILCIFLNCFCLESGSIENSLFTSIVVVLCLQCLGKFQWCSRVVLLCSSLICVVVCCLLLPIVSYSQIMSFSRFVLS